jgi:hypothetical protein
VALAGTVVMQAKFVTRRRPTHRELKRFPPVACLRGETMDVIHDRVAGLDVHKETIVACVRIMAGGKATRECRTFDTTTAGLEALLS